MRASLLASRILGGDSGFRARRLLCVAACLGPFFSTPAAQAESRHASAPPTTTQQSVVSHPQGPSTEPAHRQPYLPYAPYARASTFPSPDDEGSLWPQAPYGRGFVESTYLLDIRQGSQLSLNAESLGNGGYETAYGDKVSFRKWYDSKWRDFRVLWITQVAPSTGVIWGLSTGEYAEKYRIDPALTLGFAHQHRISKNATLSFSGTTVFGGRLKEKPCTADYGDIGGVQQVNCRLAATPLAPSETLQYLVREKPGQDIRFMVRLSVDF